MIVPQCRCRGYFHHDLGLSEPWSFQALKSPVEVPPVLDEIVERMQGAGYGQRDCFAVRLALEEAIVNAIYHGHRGDTRKTVLLRLCLTATFVMSQVEDEGPGFCLEDVPDPRTAVEQGTTGRGLLLMRHFMDSVEFNATGNCVTMCKHRARGEGREVRGE